MSKPINPINILLTQKSDPDKIIDYLMHPDDERYSLSPALAVKLDRMRDCRDLIKKHGSRTTVIPLLISEFNVSNSEAIRIFNETLEVFNATASTNGRDFYIDMLLGFMIETRNKAYSKRDFMAAAKSEKNMLDLIKEFLGTNDAKVYENIQPPNVTYLFDPGKLGVTLPDDLDYQISKILERKRGNTGLFDDAKIIDE